MRKSENRAKTFETLVRSSATSSAYAPRSCDTQSSSSRASLGEKGRRREDALSGLKDLQSALGDLNDIAARERLMSEIADANAKGGKRPNRVPFVAGVIYGSQDARTGALLKAAEKAHAEFSHVKTFWKS